ncbi:unnamed protein product, partial [Amoebophrya sp. A120]
DQVAASSHVVSADGAKWSTASRDPGLWAWLRSKASSVRRKLGHPPGGGLSRIKRKWRGGADIDELRQQTTTAYFRPVGVNQNARFRASLAEQACRRVRKAEDQHEQDFIVASRPALKLVVSVQDLRFLTRDSKDVDLPTASLEDESKQAFVVIRVGQFAEVCARIWGSQQQPSAGEVCLWSDIDDPDLQIYFEAWRGGRCRATVGIPLRTLGRNRKARHRWLLKNTESIRQHGVSRENLAVAELRCAVVVWHPLSHLFKPLPRHRLMQQRALRVQNALMRTRILDKEEIDRIKHFFKRGEALAKRMKRSSERWKRIERWEDPAFSLVVLALLLMHILCSLEFSVVLVFLYLCCSQLQWPTSPKPLSAPGQVQLGQHTRSNSISHLLKNDGRKDLPQKDDVLQKPCSRMLTTQICSGTAADISRRIVRSDHDGTGTRLGRTIESGRMAKAKTIAVLPSPRHEDYQGHKTLPRLAHAATAVPNFHAGTAGRKNLEATYLTGPNGANHCLAGCRVEQEEEGGSEHQMSVNIRKNSPNDKKGTGLLAAPRRKDLEATTRPKMTRSNAVAAGGERTHFAHDRSAAALVAPAGLRQVVSGIDADLPESIPTTKLEKKGWWLDALLATGAAGAAAVLSPSSACKNSNWTATQRSDSERVFLASLVVP